MSLKSFLSRLILVCVLPLVVMAVYLATSRIHALQAEREVEALNQARNLTTALDRLTAARISALQVLASSSTVNDPARLAEFYHEAQEFRSRFGGHVVFADLANQMIFNTRTPLGEVLPKLPSVKGQSSVATMVATGKPAVGDLFIGPVNKAPLVSIAVPVFQAGRISHILLAVMETGEYQHHLDALALPSDWIVSLLDSKNDIIARRSMPAGDGKVPVTTRRFVVKSALAPWSVMLAIPTGTFWTPANAAAAALVAAVLAATLISVLGGVLAGRRLAAAVASLAEPAGPAALPPITEIETVRAMLADSQVIREKAEASVRASEERYRELVQSANSAILRWRHDGIITFCNEFAQSFFGYRADELIGSHVGILVPDRESSGKDLSRLVEDIATNPDHYRNSINENICRDGRRVWMTWSNSPVLDEAGQVVEILTIGNDITQRKLAEEQLQLSEEKFSRAFARNPAAIALTRLDDGLFLEVNDTWLTLLGYSREEAIGRSARTMRIWPTDEEARRFIEELCGKGTLQGWEQVFYKKSGEQFVAQLSAQVLTVNNEPVILSILVDVTARQQAEAALRESEQRFQDVVQTSEDWVWEMDEQARYTYASRNVEQILGYTADEIIGRTPFELMPADEAVRVQSQFSRIAASKAPFRNLVNINRHKDGSMRHLVTSGMPIVDALGQLKGYRGMDRDVTEQKKLEEQFRQSQKMEAIGHLAGGVAHDFNNMLSVILGYAEMALMKMSPYDPLHKHLEEIRQAGKRSTDLTRQLLAFARKESAVPEVVNLNTTIAEQLKMLMRLIGEEVRIQFQPAAELWNVSIDPSQIDQILANLAVNARDAMGGPGTVVMQTANVTLDAATIHFYAGLNPGDYVLLQFSDSGCGMDGETQTRIFEPFFTTKEEGKGTGLGLSTVYGIVKQNGGTINVYSELGLGTTFKLYLPRFVGDVAMQREEKKRVPATGHETVLVVEDSEQILNLVRAMLEGNGYRVLAAATPEQACRLVAGHPDRIELLITDVVMPQMNGKQLQVKMNRLKPGIRTLFMSGYMADVIAERGVIDQGVNFISKPFSQHALLSKVRAVLDTPASPANPGEAPSRGESETSALS